MTSLVDGNSRASLLAEGNKALREGELEKAISVYAKALQANPALSKTVVQSMAVARRRFKASRSLKLRHRVAVCGWDLSHNAAGRVYTLAQLYQSFADVEIIGSIFSKSNEDLWGPIKNTEFTVRSLMVDGRHNFFKEAISLVAEHPYDLVHLSKPRITNIIFGLLYKLIWDAQVIVDIDDEEKAFVGQCPVSELSEFVKNISCANRFDDLAGKEWTHLAIELSAAFDDITVSNPALRALYGGEIVRHARDEKLYRPSTELKQRSREQLQIPLDKKVVIFFGTPREHKGLLQVADLISSLKHNNLVFVVVGEFDDQKLKHAVLSKEGLNCIFIGNQPFSSAHNVVASGDYCILMQDQGSLVSKYQVPAKMSDALGMGLIVLATESPATADLKVNYPFLCLRPAEVAQVFQRSLEDEEFAADLRRKSLEAYALEFGFLVNTARLRQSVDKGQRPLRKSHLERFATLFAFDQARLIQHLLPLAGFSEQKTDSVAPVDGAQSLQQDARHTVSVRSQIATVQEAEPAKDKIASKFKGVVEHFDEQSLRLWAIDENRPGKAVTVSIFVDDVHVIDLKTSSVRADLTKKGMNGNVAGLVFEYPRGIFDGSKTIDIRFAGTAQSLAKSPRPIDLPKQLKVRWHSDYLTNHRVGLIKNITVIVPIYNAYAAVQDCLESLTRHLPRNAQVLMIDDCSPDTRIRPMLQGYAKRHGFRLHRNSTNLGYTRSINKAISMSSDDDVVLLNSDTVVTARWLEKMRYGAYAVPQVATVTAFSDNAGAFSSPEIAVYNPVPPHLDQDEFAYAIGHAGGRTLPEVATGNGFCMFIRRAALQKLGLFDEKKFPRGYGEENDFCMRALRAGWKNIACDTAYVFHKRSQSFQSEKHHLMEAGAQQLNASYPEYRLLTPRFRDLEFSMLRQRARRGVTNATGENTKSRILFVISTQTGGTPQTNQDLMKQMESRFSCFLLRCDSKAITLSQLSHGRLSVIETITLTKQISPITHRSDEYDQAVLHLLYEYSISLLHIRHIAWHSFGLVDVAKSLGIPVAYSLHDFYTLCPSLNLLDQNMQYCKGRCSDSVGDCTWSLWSNMPLPPLKSRFVHQWRAAFDEFMDKCDVLITTAQSAADLIEEIYPTQKGKLRVIPHGRNFNALQRVARRPGNGEKIRVLVPGNISATKGSFLLKEMIKLDTQGQFEFHFLGDTAPEVKEVGIHHGKYDRSDFAFKVDAIQPHVGVVLSIWPETYCHTLTEMWACGIPVFGINLGAVGDRIQASGAGWLLKPGSSAEQVLEQILIAVRDSLGYERKLEATHRWQETEGVWNDETTMATEYRAIYQALMQPAGAQPLRKLGLVIKGEKSHPATAHIRVLRPYSSRSVREVVDIRLAPVDWLLAGGIDKLDGVLVQRDALPVKQVDDFLQAISERSLPFIYEIDDLLWDIPPDNTDHAITPEVAAAMLKLTKAATCVTTSTATLAQALADHNSVIRVVGNYHDEKLWLEPLSPEFIEQVLRTADVNPRVPTLLYMGTKSHAADLEVISPAIAQVVEQVPELQILQVGGGTLLPHSREIKVPRESLQYPAFVKWFRALASCATIAIAPLRENNFNLAKSDIKCLDYGFAKVPAIYTDFGSYRATVVHEQTGLLCLNTVPAWRAAIMKLLSDHALQARIRSQAFDAAVARGVRSAGANVLAQVLQEIFCSEEKVEHTVTQRRFDGFSLHDEVALATS